MDPLLGNVKGADLQNNSQSTPHVDPQAGTGRYQIDHVIPVTGKHRHLYTGCLAKVHMIVWNPKGIPTRSMENMKWHSPSQVQTAKHVSYPQLITPFVILKFWHIYAFHELFLFFLMQDSLFNNVTLKLSNVILSS